jgi:hypothetical protein
MSLACTDPTRAFARPLSAHLRDRAASLDLEGEAIGHVGLRAQDHLPRVSLQRRLDTLNGGSEISKTCSPDVDHVAAKRKVSAREIAEILGSSQGPFTAASEVIDSMLEDVAHVLVLIEYHAEWSQCLLHRPKSGRVSDR